MSDKSTSLRLLYVQGSVLYMKDTLSKQCYDDVTTTDFLFKWKKMKTQLCKNIGITYMNSMVRFIIGEKGLTTWVRRVPWDQEWSLLSCSSQCWLRLAPLMCPYRTCCSHRWRWRAASKGLPYCRSQKSDPVKHTKETQLKKTTLLLCYWPIQSLNKVALKPQWFLYCTWLAAPSP